MCFDETIKRSKVSALQSEEPARRRYRKDYFATKETLEIADYFGVESGSKVNKIEKAGCHVHKSAHVNAPIIEECPVTLECEVVSYSDETGVLVGKIIAQQADEAVLTGGVVDFSELHLSPKIFSSLTATL